MQPSRRFTRCALVAMAASALFACAGQKEPAQKLIGDIESTITAASPEAAKYVPDQLAGAKTSLAVLQTSFDKQDYAAVVAGAPAVLSAAQNLATAAAAKKDKILKALNEEWTALAATLPGHISVIQSRIELLGKKSNRKMAAGIDLDAAKSAAADITSLWSKAQAAFAAGNLNEAVTTAKQVRGKIDTLAPSLKLSLPAPAAAPPRAASP